MSILLAEAKANLTRQKTKEDILNVETSGMLKSAPELSTGKSASTSLTGAGQTGGMLTHHSR